MYCAISFSEKLLLNKINFNLIFIHIMYCQVRAGNFLKNFQKRTKRRIKKKEVKYRKKTSVHSGINVELSANVKVFGYFLWNLEKTVLFLVFFFKTIFNVLFIFYVTNRSYY